MKKTKVVNQTGSSIKLKEGTAGVYRMLCPELKDKDDYTINVDTNATYREYWCAVTSGDEKHVVLSSDDCMEYKEVRIKLKDDGTYTWDAVKRDSRVVVKDAGQALKQPQVQDGQASTQPHAQDGQASPSTSDSGPGFVGKVWNKIRGWFP